MECLGIFTKELLEMPSINVYLFSTFQTLIKEDNFSTYLFCCNVYFYLIFKKINLSEEKKNILYIVKCLLVVKNRSKVVFTKVHLSIERTNKIVQKSSSNRGGIILEN